MKKVQNLVASTKDKYTDKEGNEKSSYVTIGKVFTNDEGFQSVMIDFMPTNPEKYWFNIYDQDKQ